MSLENTRDIGKVKLVMLGGGGGGGSYTAGNGINITNNVITNTRKGALTGVIDSVSSNIAHTQIDNALTTTTAGALVVLKAEASGTSVDTVRVQYGAQASESSDFRLRDTDGNYTTIDIASDDTIIMMLNATGYQMIVLSILGASTGGGYSGLGIGKKKTVTNNIIDTDIDLHRAPIVGDRLLIYFDEKVTNPTGLTTYNNGTAVTSNLENVTPLYINDGLNILEFKNDGLLYNNCWVRKQNISIPETLAGMSDTLINSPSDGQMLVYDNNMWKNKTAVQANPTGTAVRELKKIQIGDNVFDTFGLKTFDVTSVTSGVSGAIAVDVITASQLNGEIIAIYTGSNTGSTGNAWTLALSDSQTVEALTMSKADGTAFTDALTANSLMFVKVNTSNDTAVVLGIVGAGSNVSANGSGSPASYLNKLKIGSAIYDTSAIRPFSVAQIANNTVKIYVADIDQLDGKVIALSTGALTGTTSSAWSLNLVDTSGGAVSLDVNMLNADGTAFSDDITANELLFVEVDLTNYEGTVLSIAGASGGGATSLASLSDTAITTPSDGQVLTYNSTTGKWKNQNPSGGGTTITKTRYTITSSSWSASANADGYYTYSVSLSPTLYTVVAPNVYIAGSTDSTAPTNTEKSMFAYVDRCRLAGYSSLTLYAKTKPTSTFYIYVEGVNGLGSGNIEGNVIKTNEVSSGGGIPYISDMPSFTMSATDRFTRVAGGWISKGNKTYVNILLKLAYSIPAYTQNPYAGEYDTRISYALPVPYAKMSNKLDVSWGQKNAFNNYLMIAEGVGHIAVGNEGKAYITVGASVTLDGTSNNIYCLIRGEYDNQ